jgi:hypothetical protein
VTALRQMTADNLKAKAFLFRPNDVVRWRSEPHRGTIFGAGSRHFVGENPPRGALIYYSLTAPAKKVRLKVQDFAGRTVRELEAKAEPGWHRVEWNLLMEEQPTLLEAVTGGERKKVPAPPGMYRVVLTVDDDEYKQGLKVEPDPTTPNAMFNVDEDNGDEDEDRPKGHPVKIDD